ncbi:tRNA (adenosine(37)-N6)-threonylcarbamoyltransferase complex dimerization subunit type 1 TsaB [Bacteroidia bacterium]|nr:tRNA (adenosine(37)-N6)-threonylcarbamoyltransferase complex dimerization subunit type 1 TsaB [Bacteroidia bacterium]
MARILCIETGTDICSAAIAQDGEVVALRESPPDRDHARNLAPFINELLRGAGLQAGQLEAVAVGMGPGSYTGLRIGVSLAKGICYGLEIPLVGVGSLRSLARMAREELRQGQRGPAPTEPGLTLLCPMIDARRMEVYSAVFDWQLDALTPVGAHIIDKDSFAGMIPATSAQGEFVIFGDGASKCVGVLPPHVRHIEVSPSARGLAVDAEEAFRLGRFEDVAYFEPFYLKDFVVTTTRKKMF